MPNTFTVIQAPSFPVIQGTYERFFPREEFHQGVDVGYCIETAYFGHTVGYHVEPSEPQVALATEPPLEDWLKFQSLIKAWHFQRSAMPWISDMALCPAYQSVIGMGPIAIPFILAQLDSEGDEPDHWFWALRVLTEADPVKEEDRGNIVKMAAAWTEWGRREGYVR